MIVDSSAILAMVFDEPGCERFHLALERADSAAISTANVLELHIVSMARGVPPEVIDTVLSRYAIDIIPFTKTHLRLAIKAHETFGKGRHRAGLNFGDCFAYALAKEQNLPLLFKGEDFAQTDVRAAA